MGTGGGRSNKRGAPSDTPKRLDRGRENLCAGDDPVSSTGDMKPTSRGSHL